MWVTKPALSMQINRKTYEYSAFFIIILTLIGTNAQSPLRLPNTVIPIRYNLTIEPQLDLKLEQPVFIGNILIGIRILEQLNNITIHAKNLDFSQDDVEILLGDLRIQCSKITRSLEDDFAILEFPTVLEKDVYLLYIKKFTGKLVKCLKSTGFYLQSYKKENGEERSFAVTNFEPAGARKAFPCFDEPALKATFIISLIRPTGYNSISNQVQKFTKNLENGRVQDTYEETPGMSTYTVAFMISDFDHISFGNIRYFAQPSVIASGELVLALNVTEKVLATLERFLGIGYTLKKMDIAVVPYECFYSEAMENWGFIIFNDRNILYSNSSTTETLQTVYGHIAHEVSHQWFGNLVTLDWWSHLWLNEGFGTFMQYYIPSLMEPEWHFMDQYTVEVYDVFGGDLTYVQPLSYREAHADNLPEAWFAYKKSSFLIKMLQQVVSEATFREGLHTYLRDNIFGSVSPKQLYQAFQLVIDRNNAITLQNLSVYSIMETWENNLGFPLVTVTRSYDRNSTVFTQERFLSKKDSQIWYIPINYGQPRDLIDPRNSTAPKFWLIQQQQEVDNYFLPQECLLVNINQMGYFRTNYDIQNWILIVNKLNSENFSIIPPINRAQLLDDSFTLAENGHIPYAIPLNLSLYLVQETEYIPWVRFFKKLEDLDYLLQATSVYSKFQRYVTYLLTPVYKHLTFYERVDESQQNKLHRPKVLQWLCKFAHNECRQNALDSLQQWRRGNITIPPNLKHVVGCNGIRADITGKEWHFLFNQLNHCDGNSRQAILASLGCSANETILNRFFDLLMDSNGNFSKTEMESAIVNLLNYNITNVDLASNYVRQHKIHIGENARLRALSFLIIYEFTTTQQLEQINDLHPYIFKGKDLKYDFNDDVLSWLNRNYLSDIIEWFSQYELNEI